MNNEEAHIDHDLIAAYLAGECSLAERKIVENWINMSDENRQEFDKYQQIFAQDFDLDEEITLSEESISPQFNVDKAWNTVTKKIDLEAPDTPVIDIQHHSTPQEKSSHRFTAYKWIGMAASIVVILSALFYFYNGGLNKDTSYAFNEGVHTIYLPDSSKIVLQGKSSLAFEAGFNESHRNLNLAGKAYFDVVENETLSFVINTEHGQVTVVGTAFTIEETNEMLTVEVERGTVKLSSLDELDNQSILLTKNEKGSLSFSKKLLEKTTMNDVNHMFWANNKLTYRQEKLSEVLDQLADTFNQEIKYDAKIIENCRISAVFKELSLEDIIKNISISLDFNYTINENIIEIHSNGCASN